jgi:hypothetical protein
LKKDIIDNWIELGKGLCSFESSKSLNFNDKTIEERLDRMMKGVTSGVAPPEIEAAMSNLFSMATGERKLTPFNAPSQGPSKSDLNEIVRRANVG